MSFAAAANFIIALIEERPVAAGNILRDAGGARNVDVNIQGLQKRLDEAVARKVIEGQLALANAILRDSLRIENLDGEAFAQRAGVQPQTPVVTVAEDAFESGRRSVEEIVELQATHLSEELAGMEAPKFLEVKVV